MIPPIEDAFKESDFGLLLNQLSQYLPIYAAVFGGVYIIYLIDVFCTSTCKYLWNMDFIEDFFQFVERMKRVMPVIGFECECFHYETRYRNVTHRDSNGNTTTRRESYQVRVVTHRERESFQYMRMDDHSGEVTLDILQFIATKVKFSKSWVFGDEQTRVVYQRQEMNFIERNRYRDVHFNNWNFFEMDGFHERKLCMVEMSKRSWWMSYGAYLVISLVALGSWPYRIWLERKTVRARFHFSKRIFLN